MGECPPIFKAEVLNITKAQNTNFFDSDLLPTQKPATFLIYFYPDSGNTGGFPSIKRTNGETTVIEAFGNVVNYTLAPFIFQILVGPGDSINLINPDSSTKIKTIIVIETTTPTGLLFPTHLM